MAPTLAAQGAHLQRLWQAAQIIQTQGAAGLQAAMRAAQVTHAVELEWMMSYLARTIANPGHLGPWVAQAGMSAEVATAAHGSTAAMAQAIATTGTAAGAGAAAGGASAGGAAGGTTAAAGTSAAASTAMAGAAALLIGGAVVGGIYMAANWGEPDAPPVKPGPGVEVVSQGEERPGHDYTARAFHVVQVSNHPHEAISIVDAKTLAAHESGDKPMYLCHFLHGGRCKGFEYMDGRGKWHKGGKNVPAELTVISSHDTSKAAWGSLCSSVKDVRAARLAAGYTGSFRGDRVTIDYKGMGSPCRNRS